ncbi:hypothetical protein GHC57_10080 [Roseospira navarrensis]|uniref:Tc1-like transposase DDE domain-containing protein n=1 Tax=Roseospira navarrensis TaxID=140058 RepID=A0A7X2D3J1_9PROT|nr:hypothetical protein [Roseospira navarrensis]
MTPGSVSTAQAGTRRGRLTVPDNISVLLLSPYAPELNPVENGWQDLRQTVIAHRVFEGCDQIDAA